MSLRFSHNMRSKSNRKKTNKLVFLATPGSCCSMFALQHLFIYLGHSLGARWNIFESQSNGASAFCHEGVDHQSVSNVTPTSTTINYLEVLRKQGLFSSNLDTASTKTTGTSEKTEEANPLPKENRGINERVMLTDWAWCSAVPCSSVQLLPLKTKTCRPGQLWLLQEGVKGEQNLLHGINGPDTRHIFSSMGAQTADGPAGLLYGAALKSFLQLFMF